MEVVSAVNTARQFVRDLQRQGKRVCVVPTMGALHEGHLSLVSLAKHHADVVVLTIFVNPLQFNAADDLAAYPRMFEADIAQAKSAGVAMLFAPTVGEMYPNYHETRISDYRSTKLVAGSCAEGFCGETRPGHFDGVVTVVATLFNILPVDCAVFGEKDYQQLKVIQQLVSDLHIPVEIIPAPLHRDANGLAMSSRNLRLSQAEYQMALAIPRSLFAARALFEAGEKQVHLIKKFIGQALEKEPAIRLDYLELVDADSLQPIDRITQSAQILVACFVGPVRLIDNLRLEM